ncbi:TPA: insulinase family protein, partial [Pluralibacter gergoviae]|nr:insulinase family protein [Pluralibacter gergoviae]
MDRLTLANGLRCHLIHQPQAREAAALLKVDAGSLQEPDRWPGLAHLLEHLLFADSADFRGEERLMPWAQRRGGQVNASTRLGESAFFFQAGADDLPVGLARLVDMLAAPLLLPGAITQEIAVIDAEYRLLQTHADTLCEAALFDLLPDPPSLGRF